MEYIFMNKNVPLLKFKTEYSLGSYLVKEICSYSDIRPLGFKDISDWIDKRDYAKHKKHLSKWLKKWGIDTIDGFIQISHCLGINDCLWVKEANSSLSWEQVNLYNNKFTDVISKTAFDSGTMGLHLKTTSPEFTCEGSFIKYWTFEEDGIYLYKFGAEPCANRGDEPYAEYMASTVCNSIFPDSVLYDLEIKKDRTCSKCRLFTNENEGFVPIYKILEDKNYTIADILEICTKLGFEKEFRRMILIDSIIFNQDRHLGNFGFIVNNDTFEILRFAPLFDFNLSMLINAMDADLNDYKKYEEAYQVEHKLGGKFAEVGKEIMTKELRKELPEKITLTQHPQYKIDEDRFQKIKAIFEANYNIILGRSKTYPVVKKKNNVKKQDGIDNT